MHLGFNEIAVFGGVHKYIRPSLCNFGQRIIRQSSHLLHLGWWWYLTGSHRGRNWIAGVEFNAHLSVLERSWDKWWLLFIRLWKGKIAIYKFHVWTRIDIAAARLTHKTFTTATVFDGAWVCVFRVVCNIWYVFLVSDLLCNAPPHIPFRYDTAKLTIILSAAWCWLWRRFRGPNIMIMTKTRLCDGTTTLWRIVDYCPNEPNRTKHTRSSALGHVEHTHFAFMS